MNITPTVAKELANKGKPATVTIGRNSIVFNPTATRILDMKEGTKFLLDEKDNKIFFKYSENVDSWKIAGIVKDCARLNTTLMHAALKQILHKPEAKSLRFTLGMFKEGMWPMTLIEETSTK